MIIRKQNIGGFTDNDCQKLILLQKIIDDRKLNLLDEYEKSLF
jgi:hypothetical protein